MLQCLLLYIHHMIDHLKKNLGWYVMIPSLYLAFAGESEIWLVIFVVLLKMPPFDLVGRYEEWLSRKMKVEERGNKLKTWKGKQSPFVKLLITIVIILLLIGWVLFMPECELC